MVRQDRLTPLAASCKGTPSAYASTTSTKPKLLAGEKRGKGRAGHHTGQDRPQRLTESRQQPLYSPVAIIPVPERIVPASGPHSGPVLEQSRERAQAEPDARRNASASQRPAPAIRGERIGSRADQEPGEKRGEGQRRGTNASPKRDKPAD